MEEIKKIIDKDSLSTKELEVLVTKQWQLTQKIDELTKANEDTKSVEADLKTVEDKLGTYTLIPNQGSDKNIHLTKDGVEKLVREKVDLLNVARPIVIEELQAARAQGDLSENADYDAARDKQAQIEARIKDLTRQLDNYTLIDEKKGGVTKVSLGATVTLKDTSDNEIEVYTIVGSVESDPENNKISNESPLAKKIEGKKVGDIVKIDNVDDVYEVEITKIERLRK